MKLIFASLIAAASMAAATPTPVAAPAPSLTPDPPATNYLEGTASEISALSYSGLDSEVITFSSGITPVAYVWGDNGLQVSTDASQLVYFDPVGSSYELKVGTPTTDSLHTFKMDLSDPILSGLLIQTSSGDRYGNFTACPSGSSYSIYYPAEPAPADDCVATKLNLLLTALA